MNLRSGNYYVIVSSFGNGTNYQLAATATSLGSVPVDNAGDSLERAKNIGVLSSTAIVTNDFIGQFNGLSTDDTDYYQFTLVDSQQQINR